MLDRPPTIRFTVNGEAVAVGADPFQRLSAVLRRDLGLEGTKIGCDAGDCGACTVLIDGAPACACLVPVGQVDGAAVVTVEGLVRGTRSGAALKSAMLAHGAAQCGICTPGMLVAAAAHLDAEREPSEESVRDALGGVLCRCTGYSKIVEAVLAASRREEVAPAPAPAGPTVGLRIRRLDGDGKVDGTIGYGADGIPADALWLRAVRSPHHHARVRLGDVEGWAASREGIVAVLTARDVPGRNLYGVLPHFADQTVFAEDIVRHRGEAVAAVVGERAAIEALDLSDFPVGYEPLPAVLGLDAALRPDAPQLHAGRPGNLLVSGRVEKGDVAGAMEAAAVRVGGQFTSGFVEHAPIEPEAGWARRVGERIEVTACTQSPTMDRDDIAGILGLDSAAVRVIPSAVGGGFGTKLDLSVQPFVALAAFVLGRAVAMVYSRPESMATTTKRHPSRIDMTIGLGADGRIAAIDFKGDFDTGAYASWGPTVANRVPVHASGPYAVPNYRARTRAIHTNAVPSGAFRGFGVPQAAIAQEQLFDEAAAAIGMDPLAFRILNVLGPDTPTGTGQVIGPGVGIRACLEALVEPCRAARAAARAFNEASDGRLRRGVGVAGMWYGCGNTSMSNPSTIRIALTREGRIRLHQGAVDIGQGSDTVIPQIAADALGLPLDLIDRVSADTDLTPDCGKTSASRQTFVTGRAAMEAGLALRARMLRLGNAGPDAVLRLSAGTLSIEDGGEVRTLRLAELPPEADDAVLVVEETFDPPTTPLDKDGQGTPYAVYGFGAHLAEVEVDRRLGTVRVLAITAAHDVGKAINPMLVEGQVEGGIAQGLGLALMEEFFPGRGENLHDYLIPTFGDMPRVTTILIEDPSPAGPYGAKGIGEQALIPTAPAILNAIADATGVRIRQVPATPDRVRAALLAAGAAP